jgi:hypothetical protein
MIQVLCFVATLWICSKLPNKTLRIIGATFVELAGIVILLGMA